MICTVMLFFIYLFFLGGGAGGELFLSPTSYRESCFSPFDSWYNWYINLVYKISA